MALIRPPGIREGSAAAVFDLDNTLVHGSSLFHFGVMMARQRRIPVRHVVRFGADEAMYVMRRRERTGISSSIAERTLTIVAGMPQVELMAHARLYARTRLDRHLVLAVLDQAREFRRAGYLTVIATASPQELATAVAERLGFDDAVGTTSEVVDGRYTGRLTGAITHGGAKARRVGQMFGEHGIDPRRSWAFSDSVNDLPLLSMVGHPVPTNPDAELLAIARTNRWRVLDGRDVTTDPIAPYEAMFPYPF